MNRLLRIALLGDSWGVPNYYGGVGPAHHHHLEFLLRYDVGHVVTNFSKNGGSNMETLTRLNQGLEIGYKCDAVIWFHTEPIRQINRDPDDIVQYRLQELNDRMAVTSYKFAKEVKYKTGCKWIVIGGQAPINPALFDSFQIADVVKYDWRSELIGKTIPESPAWGRLRFLESHKWIDTPEVKDEWLTKHEIVRNELQNSSLFPDNAHPGMEAHRELNKWLYDHVLGNI